MAQKRTQFMDGQYKSSKIWQAICFSKRVMLACLLSILSNAVMFQSAMAAGTPAGTVISNQATVSYSFGPGPLVVQQTNIASFRVLQVLDVSVQNAEVGAVLAGSPDLRRAMSFIVTNSGNGPDQFRLARQDNLPADQFDPQASATPIYVENGLAPGLQTTGPNADLLYAPGSNDINLAAGESRRIYLLSDLQAGLVAGAQGRSRLLAESTLAGAAGAVPGQSASATRIAGLEAVVGASQARANSIGVYQISGVIVRMEKTLKQVRDPQGGQALIPGSSMTYQVKVIVEGSGVANNVQFSDPLPLQTTYRANSLRVSGTARTDATDGDGAEYSNNQILARLGNLTAPTQVDIEFDAIVQ